MRSLLDYHRPGRIWARTELRRPYPSGHRFPAVLIPSGVSPPGETGIVHLLDAIDTGDASTYPSSGSWSFSWAANAPIFLEVTNTDSNAAEAVSSIGGTNGLTWTEVATVQYDSSSTKRKTVLVAKPTSSGSGTIEINFPTSPTDPQTTCAISIDQFAGIDNTNPVVQPKTGGITVAPGVQVFELTFDSAVTTGNWTYYTVSIDANDASLLGDAEDNPDTLTQLANGGGGAPPFRRAVAYKESAVQSPAMGTDVNRFWGAIAIELLLAGAAAGQPYIKRVGGVPFMAINRGTW